MEEIHRRIPHRPPFLFIDNILEISDNGARASLAVRKDFAFFEGHYPGNPIMPGVLLCESVFQTGAVFLADHLKEQTLTEDNVTPVLSRIRDARFKRMVLPGDHIEISVSLKDKMGQFYNLTGEIKNKDKTALTISFALALVKDSE
ncbi:MAG: beta-hydroxyacyl-ACP dehydratase [Opitutae bacterium]|mgnify:FL=1|nr:beta-hydroxyacyl-ACP dehydratase [Opitutae bacterium]MBT5717452.1 beta-hydroxyacyl-ACP dehydratase [Opitutae bacterium]